MNDTDNKSHHEQPDLPGDLAASVANAIREDVGDGDITAALINDGTTANATVQCMEPAVVCGRPWFDEVFAQLDPTIDIEWRVHEGDEVLANTTLCELGGEARSLVTGERTALNYLQTLSATATQAKQFADAVEGTGCRILDTRKTLPGLRTAQKYAVRCGSAFNHRHGLYDAILIKENHIMASGSIDAAVKRARDHARSFPVQVEVENTEQLEQAIAAGADSVLLDNFDLAMLTAAVDRKQALASRIVMEASGGFDLSTVRAAAETGVDCISVGALTKNLRAIDLSMRLRSTS